MDLRQLRLFLSVFDSRSISASASTLGMSQPALSKLIRRLEHDLGAPLFDRLPRGMEPNVFGRTLEHFARTIDANYRSAERQIDALRAAGQGETAIGAGPTWRDGPLPRAIARLIRTKPKARVQIIGGTMDEQIGLLLRGDLDFILATVPQDESLAKLLSVVPLMRHVLSVIVRQDHPLTSRAKVTMTDLSKLRWALPLGTAVRARFEKLFVLGNLPLPIAAIESQDIGCLLDIVANTDLATYAPLIRLSTDRVGRLKALACPDADTQRETGILMRRGSTLPPLARTLIDELKRAVAETNEQA